MLKAYIFIFPCGCYAAAEVSVIEKEVFFYVKGQIVSYTAPV